MHDRTLSLLGKIQDAHEYKHFFTLHKAFSVLAVESAVKFGQKLLILPGSIDILCVTCTRLTHAILKYLFNKGYQDACRTRTYFS